MQINMQTQFLATSDSIIGSLEALRLYLGCVRLCTLQIDIYITLQDTSSHCCSSISPDLQSAHIDGL